MKVVAKGDPDVQRLPAVDLIRTVGILLVILTHFSLYAFEPPEGLSGRLLFHCRIIHLIEIATKDCNALFVLLSGYILACRPFKANKCLRLLGMVWFYSIGLYAVGVLTGLRILSWEMLYTNLNCLWQYWFFRYYFCLMFFLPFLNMLISHLTHKGLRLLIGLLAALCFVERSMSPLYSNIAEVGSLGVLTSFIFCYLVGAYIRAYYPHGGRKTVSFSLYTICILLGYLGGSETVLSSLQLNRYWMAGYLRCLHLVGFVGALSLFVGLLSFDLRTERLRRFLALFAPLSFGIYLIHDSNHLRLWIYQTLNTSYFIQQSTVVFCLFILCEVLVICVVCGTIEALRKWASRVLRAHFPGLSAVQRMERIFSDLFTGE